MDRFPVIVGPTAGGKSALAIALARRIIEAGGRAEVVTADAFQVYRGMDIGTAKPTPDETRGVVHHLIDLVDPAERFTAKDWLSAAERVIDGCRARGVTPIVVGGTHLYVKLLMAGMFSGPGADDRLRAELAALPVEELRRELERIDPASAARLHPNDLRRTIRAIEVHRLTGKPISEQQTQWETFRPDAGLVGVEWPVEAINRRINSRVAAMIEDGLVDEARGLWSRRAFGPQAREALGYKQLIAHFEGDGALDRAIERIKIETRRFAKNQRTWLKRLRVAPGSLWIDATAGDPDAWAGMIVGAAQGR